MEKEKKKLWPLNVLITRVNLQTIARGQEALQGGSKVNHRARQNWVVFEWVPWVEPFKSWVDFFSIEDCSSNLLSDNNREET